MKLQPRVLELVLVALLWVVLFTLTPLGVDIAWPTEFWVRLYFFAFLLTGAYYLNSKLLLPRFFSDNRFVLYGVIVLVLVFLMLFILYFFEQQIELPQRMHELFRPDRPFEPRGWRFRVDDFMIIIFNFSLGIIVYLIRKNQIDSERRKELEKLQVSTELSYLKAQINPHFFFNTLNNIYALTSIDTDASRNAILTLSSMMRYVIYDGTSRFAPLEDELKFIENYIALMKLRLPERVTIQYERPKKTENLEVAPMILLPFIENAFKHGVSGSGPSEIVIDVTVSEKKLSLFVKNSIIPNPKLAADDHGIGIANTRRRLELLYPEAHHLNINDQEGTFEVTLEIYL
jgi:energy-coupling factor transporter transmembrane protein EcfT